MKARRHRYRFRRRHTPHFFLATATITAAVSLCIVDTLALPAGRSWLSTVALVWLAATVVTVLASYFWGFFMVMNGNIPVRRLKIFLPHAVVGSLSPLLYMLNLSLALDGSGRYSVHALGLVLATLSAAIIAIQYLMGRRVTRVEGLRVVPRAA